MPRRLRIAASYCCLVLCFATAASWYRSHHSYTWIRGEPLGNELGIQPWQGRVEFYIDFEPRPRVKDRWVWVENDDDEPEFAFRAELMSQQGIPSHGFRLSEMKSGWAASIPHWTLALVTAAACIALRPSPRLRFGLRDIFAVLTIAAVVFGSFKALPWLMAPSS